MVKVTRTTTTKTTSPSLNNNVSVSQSALMPMSSIAMSVVTVTPYEAEHILNELPPLTNVQQVGTLGFLHHYGYQLERLALQGHASAQQAAASSSILISDYWHMCAYSTVRALLRLLWLLVSTCVTI
jgi:hypothetical protein